jgi:hypothetical protein
MEDQMKEFVEISIDRKLDSIRTDVKSIQAMLTRYAAGFPGDDPDGHRKYHETLIERNKAYTDLGRKLLFELAKWGLIGFLGWMLVAGWHDVVTTVRNSK